MKDRLSLELSYSRKYRFSVINIKKDIEVMARNYISNDKECKKRNGGGWGIDASTEYCRWGKISSLLPLWILSQDPVIKDRLIREKPREVY